VAVRRAVLTADPAAARQRAERARRERGVQLWPQPDGMATLSAYLSAAEAVGAFAVLDEHARHAGGPDEQRSMDARRADALVDLILGPIGFTSAGSSTTPAPRPPQHPRPRCRPRAGHPGHRCPLGERTHAGSWTHADPDPGAGFGTGRVPVCLRALPPRRRGGDPGHAALHRAARRR
jgi:hypothetical protein